MLTQALRAIREILHAHQVPGNRRIGRQVFQREFKVKHHGLQDVVELVRNAAGQRAQRPESLVVMNLVLEVAAIRLRLFALGNFLRKALVDPHQVAAHRLEIVRERGDLLESAVGLQFLVHVARGDRPAGLLQPA